MTGHEPLIAMRRQGFRPRMVYVVDEQPASQWWQWQESLAYPLIVVEPEDTPERLDLRFLVGLPVDVFIRPDVARMHRLVLACERAGASVVVGQAAELVAPWKVETTAFVCTNAGDQAWRN